LGSGKGGTVDGVGEALKRWKLLKAV